MSKFLIYFSIVYFPFLFSGEPDDVSQSSVPYGRLQANAEDYNDDVMLVNT